MPTRFTAAVCGRTAAAVDGTSTGDPIPNGSSVPQYYSINLGAEQSFKLARNRFLKARLDVVNVTDNIYELRAVPASASTPPNTANGSASSAR
jgi:hypothetical protein